LRQEGRGGPFSLGRGGGPSPFLAGARRRLGAGEASLRQVNFVKCNKNLTYLAPPLNHRGENPVLTSRVPNPLPSLS
jgi:hypothetical protein